MLKPLTDERVARWVVDALAPLGAFRVQSHVPRVFERYARIDHPHDDGWLPDIVAKPLKDILRPHTPEGTACWFGVWRGWGATYKPNVPATSYIDSGAREWDLFCGPLDALDSRFFVDFDATVNLAWSKDRAWFLSTDIDLDRTFMGCNSPVLVDVLEDEGLRAVEVRPEDPPA